MEPQDFRGEFISQGLFTIRHNKKILTETFIYIYIWRGIVCMFNVKYVLMNKDVISVCVCVCVYCNGV